MTPEQAQAEAREIAAKFVGEVYYRRGKKPSRAEYAIVDRWAADIAAALLEREGRSGDEAAADAGATLFRRGAFTLHSGELSAFKIDCDALTGEDWAALASLIAPLKAPFSDVVGVPRGGLKLAAALRPYCGPLGPVLIVDDVLTTGASIAAVEREVAVRGNTTFGAVVFARGPVPAWVTPLFVLTAAPASRSAATCDPVMQVLVNHVSADLGDDPQAYIAQIEYNVRAETQRVVEAAREVVAKNTRVRLPAEFANPDDWIVVTRAAFDTLRAALPPAPPTTRQYPCGCTATGVGVPPYCPEHGRTP